jgi:hypothetical protein
MIYISEERITTKKKLQFFIDPGSEVKCHEVLRQQPCGDTVLRSRNRAFSWGQLYLVYDNEKFHAHRILLCYRVSPPISACESSSKSRVKPQFRS